MLEAEVTAGWRGGCHVQASPLQSDRGQSWLRPLPACGSLGWSLCLSARAAGAGTAEDEGPGPVHVFTDQAAEQQGAGLDGAALNSFQTAKAFNELT